MSTWKVGVFCCAFVACGGNTEAVATGTTAPMASATTAPSGAVAQCNGLSARVDTFNADIAKIDPKTPEGLQSLGATAMTASKDVSAMHPGGELDAIARDTSAYLADTSNKVVEIGTILLRIMAAGKDVDAEAIKKCVGEPSRRIGVACKGKTSGDCPKVMAALDTWGRATRLDIAPALAQFRALQVTDPAVKKPVADIAQCTAPLAGTLDEIERNKARLKEIEAPDTRETDIDARFKTICGRGLFTK